MHAQVLQRTNGLGDGSNRRNADVLDEHILGRSRATLHTVEHNTIGASLDRERRVVERTGGAHLHIDGHLPVGDLAQLDDLDGEIVGAGPVGVAARRALVDADRQITHLADTFIDLLSEQHSATTGLSALANNHLDGVGLAKVVGVHAITRRQVLIHERR